MNSLFGSLTSTWADSLLVRYGFLLRAYTAIPRSSADLPDSVFQLKRETLMSNASLQIQPLLALLVLKDHFVESATFLIQTHPNQLTPEVQNLHDLIYSGVLQ